MNLSWQDGQEQQAGVKNPESQPDVHAINIEAPVGVVHRDPTVPPSHSWTAAGGVCSPSPYVSSSRVRLPPGRCPSVSSKTRPHSWSAMNAIDFSNVLILLSHNLSSPDG